MQIIFIHFQIMTFGQRRIDFLWECFYVTCGIQFLKTAIDLWGSNLLKPCLILREISPSIVSFSGKISIISCLLFHTHLIPTILLLLCRVCIQHFSHVWIHSFVGVNRHNPIKLIFTKISTIYVAPGLQFQQYLYYISNGSLVRKLCAEISPCSCNSC